MLSIVILTASAVSVSVSAASSLGPCTYDALYSNLSTTEGHVDTKVLAQMIRFFAATTPLANQ